MTTETYTPEQLGNDLTALVIKSQHSGMSAVEALFQLKYATLKVETLLLTWHFDGPGNDDAETDESQVVQ
jgi:hypothetical protein